MRLLLVEDDLKLQKLLQRALIEEGWQVEICQSGEEALDWLDQHSFDAVILDWRLPGISGLDVLKKIRSTRLPTAVLMLTANEEIEHRVQGLDAGADDYLSKPFALAELSARLRALMRRNNLMPEPPLGKGPLLLQESTRQASFQGKSLNLTDKEYRLLGLFLRHGGRVLTRSAVADHLWGLSFELGSNVIEVHVRNLRRKLEEVGGEGLLETLRGVGYRLNLDKLSQKGDT